MDERVMDVIRHKCMYCFGHDTCASSLETYIKCSPENLSRCKYSYSPIATMTECEQKTISVGQCTLVAFHYWGKESFKRWWNNYVQSPLKKDDYINLERMLLQAVPEWKDVWEPELIIMKAMKD